MRTEGSNVAGKSGKQRHTGNLYLAYHEDTTVLPYNSICFVQALAKYGIPAEYHLFPEGYHGIGLGNELTANEDGRGIVRGCEEWSSLCEKWLNRRFPWWNPGV